MARSYKKDIHTRVHLNHGGNKAQTQFKKACRRKFRRLTKTHLTASRYDEIPRSYCEVVDLWDSPGEGTCFRSLLLTRK